MESSVYYQQLMQLLQSHYDVQITLMNSKELEGILVRACRPYRLLQHNILSIHVVLSFPIDIDSGIHGPDFLWVKKACQHCYIYLGDIGAIVHYIT